MDDRDLRIINLRAQAEGQEQTIKELEAQVTALKAEAAKMQFKEAELTKELQKMTALFNDLRDKHTRLIGQIMELMAKLQQ